MQQGEKCRLCFHIRPLIKNYIVVIIDVRKAPLLPLHTSMTNVFFLKVGDRHKEWPWGGFRLNLKLMKNYKTGRFFRQVREFGIAINQLEWLQMHQLTLKNVLRRALTRGLKKHKQVPLWHTKK